MAPTGSSIRTLIQQQHAEDDDRAGDGADDQRASDADERTARRDADQPAEGAVDGHSYVGLPDEDPREYGRCERPRCGCDVGGDYDVRDRERVGCHVLPALKPNHPSHRTIAPIMAEVML
jgi:hypothetical protein